ncbi:PREDICTED: RNA-binding protein 26 isoform X2 [Nicrophorus vespilloides]|uniref:RNA-binding protein 26 isoform X2 n=1 Tax=Nicrophorus vespilloides TaxID=110193 RepID=A0ABM1MBS8_NICVS|nr:PREDICTED: RNA-binding protein 26 isoform X2 [Nicrophorus vespilloides]
MIIEDPDAFKTWLTAVLKPICEADPSALAKYVIALVKKDKSPEVLRQSMVNQLEVFLQKETEPFVTQLFKTLETQDYINSVIPNANPPNPNMNLKLTEVATVTPPAKVVAKALPIIPVSEIAANLTETLNGKGIIKDAKELEKKDVKKEEEKPLRRRSRHRSLSRNRSRSRSWDRTRRSRSRDKSRERDRLDRDKRERVRSWRNKSPPRRYDRRRSVSPGGRPRSRSRSPRHNYRGRYRNRSPPLRSTSRSRSRSLERRDRKEMKDRETAQSGAGTPTQDSNHAVDMDLRLTQSVQSAVVVQPPPPANRPPGVPLPSVDGSRRCRDYDEKGFCMRGEMCPYDHGVDPVVLEDSTLSRVLYAPNGTGDNMLVPPPSIVIPGPNPIMHMRPNLPAEYNPQAPQMWHHRPPNFRGGHRGGGMNSGPPRVPPMGFNPQNGPPLPNIQQRELISVPVLDSGNQQDNYGGGGGGYQQQQQQNNGPPPQNSGNTYIQDQQQPGGFKKKPFDYNRLGPRQKNPSNCSLELKKVPTGLNNITHLNNHFHRFGKIVNIQVSYDGDPEAAIVTFSSHAEANVAYRSTEAVLNNRFIKVFWHTGNADSSRQENVPPRPIKERLGGQSGPGGSMLHHSIGNVAPNANKVLNLVQPKANQDIKGGSADAVEDDPEKIKELEAKKEEMKAQASLAIKKGQELLAAKEKMKKNQEQKLKEAVKLTANLRRRKQELLEKQLAQQKLLIEKLEKCSQGSQRDLLMQTIKKSQDSIEVIRKDISICFKTAAGVGGTPTSPSATSTAMLRKTKEEVQKEVLDAELDLISKQAEGVDVTELQKKIHDMKAKIPTLLSSSVAAPAIRGSWTRGRARFNPIGRHLLTKNNLLKDRMKLKSPSKTTGSSSTSQQTHAVDHRPTRILVSGYESDEQESVLTHFGQFGEIVEYVSDASTPSVVLNYKTRKEAEFAVVKGKHFQDRTLSVTWCNNAQLNTLSRSSSRTVLINESEEQHLIDSALLDGDEDIGTVLPEEVLLQDDEEEEEENEDRSWRR